MNLCEIYHMLARYHDITISRHLDIGRRERERDQCPFFVAAVDGGVGVGVLAGAETSGSKKRRGGLT